jgi:uncharacterized repeat protein (TIGR03847 family)
MGEPIELDPVDSLGAGAIGEPGQRAFYIQAGKAGAQLTVLVEKEQVALLAAEAVAFLERISEDFPEESADTADALRSEAGVREPIVPLFRATLIGLGFEPERKLVLIELRERGGDDEGEEGDETGEAAGAAGGGERDEGDAESEEGYIARLYATRAQVRAMAARAVESVAAGRPRCPLCDFPMDPQGHRCPRWN